jgi:hypothetical protein
MQLCVAVSQATRSIALDGVLVIAGSCGTSVVVCTRLLVLQPDVKIMISTGKRYAEQVKQLN